jgi:NAD(P)-dependent dehydrogenase (short-subunit alcohol dehydrogenase family)
VVAVASRAVEHRDAGVAAVEAAGGRAAGIELDVREPESVAAAFDEAESALGPLSVLVNNAAANFPVPAADLSPNGWRAVERIVLDGTFFCSQELHRRVTARGDNGRDPRQRRRAGAVPARRPARRHQGRPRPGRRRRPTAGRPGGTAARVGLGGDVAVLAVRGVRDRARAGRRRRQLAAARLRDAAGHIDPRATPPVSAGIQQ